MKRARTVPPGLLAALAVAFLLGLPFLGSEQLWFDEVLSWSIYRHSPNLSEMTAYLAANENHPPLYYYLMYGFIRMFGDAPVAIRFFSVLMTVLATGLVYGITRRWFGARTASAAALLYALSPLVAEFSREARPYALISVLALAGWYALSRWYAEGWQARWLGAFVAVTILGIYTHYAYQFLLASQILTAILLLGRQPAGHERRRRWLSWWGAMIMIGVAFLPWLPTMVTHLAEQYVYPEGLTPISQTVAVPNFILLDVVMNFLFFPTKWPVDALGRTLQVAAAALLGCGIIGFGVSAWRRYRTAASAGLAALADWDHLFVLLLWAVVPVGLYLFSPIAGRYSWYYFRHLLPIVPALAIVAALGLRFLLGRLARQRLPLVIVGAGLAFVLMNAPQYFTDDSRWDGQHQFADVARFIEQQDGGGTELIIGSWYGYRLLLDYYYRGGQTVGSLVPESRYSNQLAVVSGAPRFSPMEGYLLTHPNIPYRQYRLPDALARYDRIWVVSVNPSLFDLDVALATAGWVGRFVELPHPVRLYLFRFERRGT